MNKTDKKTLEEIIRVDHAGERGAIKIYEGQLLALKTFKQDDELKRKIEDMREHEKEHFEFFDKEIQKFMDEICIAKLPMRLHWHRSMSSNSYFKFFINKYFSSASCRNIIFIPII